MIFVGVWLALVLLYCLFKTCGGWFTDTISCDGFSGQCFDCWRAGGTIDRYYGKKTYMDPWGPYSQPQPQLPPIVVVNNTKDRRDSSSDEEDDPGSPHNRGSHSRYVRPNRPGNPVSLDPERREEAGGALLLRSAGTNRLPGTAPRERQPIVV